MASASYADDGRGGHGRDTKTTSNTGRSNGAVLAGGTSSSSARQRHALTGGDDDVKRRSMRDSKTVEQPVVVGWRDGWSFPLVMILVCSFLIYTTLGSIAIVSPLLINSLVNGDVKVSSKSELVYGVWGAVNMACQFTSSRFWGEVSDSVGRRKILMMSALGTVVLHISCAFTPVLWPMFIGIAVEGVTAAGYSVGQAYIADLSDRGTMGTNFGLFYGLALGGGFAVGVPLAAAILTVTGNLRAPFYATIGLGLLAFALYVFVVPESLPKARRRPIEWKKANPLGALSVITTNKFVMGMFVQWVCITMARGGVQAVFINYASSRWGWGSLTNSLFFVMAGVSMLVYPRILIPRFGEVKCIIAGNIINCLSAILTGTLSQGWIVFAGQAFLLAGDIIYPATLSLLCKQVDRDHQGAMQGTADCVRTVFMLVGTLGTASIYSYFISPTAAVDVPGAGFYAIALMHTAGGCAASLAVLYYGHLQKDLAADVGHARDDAEEDRRAAAAAGMGVNGAGGIVHEGAGEGGGGGSGAGGGHHFVSLLGDEHPRSTTVNVPATPEGRRAFLRAQDSMSQLPPSSVATPTDLSRTPSLVHMPANGVVASPRAGAPPQRRQEDVHLLRGAASPAVGGATTVGAGPGRISPLRPISAGYGSDAETPRSPLVQSSSRV